MIMVDVYVPSVDKEYDFNLDPQVRISTIIEEIGEMIAYKEHSTIDGDMEELILCDRQKNMILPMEKTLETCGIKTGSKLILV